jgi:hypothetical protein
MLPEFIKNAKISYRTIGENYLNFILDSKGVKIASYGRIDWNFHKIHKIFHHYDELAVFIKAYPGRSIIYFSNNETDPIDLLNIDISENLYDIIYEDWDCWIINKDWVIEKYHIGR